MNTGVELFNKVNTAVVLFNKSNTAVDLFEKSKQNIVVDFFKQSEHSCGSFFF